MRVAVSLVCLLAFLGTAYAQDLPKKEKAALEGLREGLAGDVDRHDLGPLVAPAVLLAMSETPEAVAAVASLVETAPVDFRAEFVLAFDPERRESFDVSDGHVRAQIERLLVARLDDTDAMGPIAGVLRGDTQLLGANMDLDPRVCDLAAHTLAALWPGRYTFDYRGSFATRERQRVEVANVYRVKHDLVPLPIPTRRHVEPLSREVSAELEKLWRGGGEARKNAEAVITSNGLSALPAVRSWLDATPDAETRGALEPLARSLATVVLAASVSSRSLPLASAVKERLVALEGTPLSSKGFLEVLLAAWKAHPKAATRARLEAHRSGDQAGFDVWFEQLPEPCHPGSTYGVSISAEVWVGSRRLMLSPGGMSCYGGHEGAWEAHRHLISAIDKAIGDAKVDDAVVIRVAFVRP
jgi:hypothetical protein